MKKEALLATHLQKNYDSAFCGSIPLHLVNLIQPHGVLVALDKANLTVIQVSENLEQFLSLPVPEILGQSIAAFLPTEQLFSELQAKIKNPSTQGKIPFTLPLKGATQEVKFLAVLHHHAEYLLLELEENRQPAGQDTFLAMYQQIKHITTLFRQANSTHEIAQMVVEELKKLTGFDRVLAYQFDPQWNGVVIGQSREEGMDDYLGLRFPASDVPKQARDLYFSTSYRLIPARDYQPVRLLPVINPLTQRFTDLSDCSLRSVAAVHLEYLTNLKVQASMSLPLIIDNQLWGLISCHHRLPLNPSYEVRSAMELLCSIASVQLAAKEREKNMELRTQLKSLHAQLVEQLYNASTFTEGLVTGSKLLLKLFDLTGAAVLFEGGVWTNGEVPSGQELKELVYWLKRNQTDQVFATDSLPSQYMRAKDYSTLASGLLVLPINAEQGEYILGFRPEVLQTVSWGGNPDQAIQMEPDGKTYHPRNSFAIYQETVKNSSLPWRHEEIEAAQVLRSAVLEKIIKERF